MHGLTVNRNIDAFGLGCPDSSWDKIANFTGKVGVFVFLGHLIMQLALHCI